jgi:tRNA nucleotidyltransferase (CCA-adding enzyme)
MTAKASCIPEVLEVADIVRRAGGRALLVGGSVRDRLMGLEPKDFDLECFGIDAGTLISAIGERFDLDLVGASFGVVKIKSLPIDVSLARRETKLGLGHRAFRMEHDKGITLAEAASRRDFTINAIYEDVLGGEILDPWGGREDLARRRLRHVSDHFCEDPLRVLRAMQFVARFILSPDEATVAVCRSMDCENLAPERMLEEWNKLILKGRKISAGLEFLRASGWLRFYPELESTVGCLQEREWHPEGDVWEHTKLCVDRFAENRRGDDAEDRIVGYAVLCHDFGKSATTAYDPGKGRICSIGHDEAGVAPTESFLRRLTNEERFVKAVSKLVRLHMRPYSLWRGNGSDNAVRRLSAEAGGVERLIRVSACDVTLREPSPDDGAHLDWLSERAEALRVKDAAPKPLLQGRDLIAMGLKPSPEFSEILAKAYEAQLDGRFRDLAGAKDFARSLSGEGVAGRPQDFKEDGKSCSRQ